MIRICGFYDRIYSDLGSQLMLASELKDRYICVENIAGIPIVDVNVEDFEEACIPVLQSETARVIMLGTNLGNFPVDNEQKYVEQTEKLEKVIAMAEKSGAKAIRVYPFMAATGQSAEVSFYPFFIKFRNWIKMAAGKGIMLAYENLKGTLGESGFQCKMINKTIKDENCKFIFNIGSFYKSGLNPIEELEEAEGSVDSIAVCDVNRNYREMPLGLGECKVKEILSKAIEKGFDGKIILYPDTAAYSSLRRKLYFNPVLKMIFKSKVELFKKIDKRFGYTRHDIVSKNDVCRAQHQLLSDMIADCSKKE